MKRRLLVAFVDALGPAQADELARSLPGLGARRVLQGGLGYSSGALATLLTGATPALHGRMCLFTAAPEPHSPLRALRWLGLLPRALHERAAVRRRVADLFARSRGWDGYFALHRVPPELFSWLDVPERDDLFRARTVGGARTFLADARDAGLEVYAAPWQLPEAERWQHTREAVRRRPADLTFLYATELDGVLHRDGNGSPTAAAALRRIAKGILDAQERLARGGVDVTTLVVGDHGMADVRRVVDPRPILRRVSPVRAFVDSTLLRVWGSDPALARTRLAAERAAPRGRWLDAAALRALGVPVTGAPYGRAIFALPEGSLFAPSYVGGRVAGMHGYLPDEPSTRAALLSDRALDAGLTRLEHVAPLVRTALGLAA